MISTDKKQEEGIACPLCGEFTPHEKVEGTTHIWSCPACPFVGFEFYVGSQLDTLIRHLQTKEY